MENTEKTDDKIEEVLTADQRAEETENLLITEGVLIPANDLIHYMTRNQSYLRLITSEQFKESGLDLEEILDDDFIKEQFQEHALTAQRVRFVTEMVIPKMQEVLGGSEETKSEEVVE